MSHPDILASAENQPIREGLEELLDFLAVKSIPFISFCFALYGFPKRDR